MKLPLPALAVMAIATIYGLVDFIESNQSSQKPNIQLSVARPEKPKTTCTADDARDKAVEKSTIGAPAEIEDDE